MNYGSNRKTFKMTNYAVVKQLITLNTIIIAHFPLQNMIRNYRNK